MSVGHGETAFGQVEAQALLDAGWTQGSVFRPSERVPVPEHLARDDAYLVVCTQACTLVSSNLDKDPHVELVVATPVSAYSPKSEQATGKQVRMHHLAVAGESFQALEVDINARFTLPRDSLLGLAPDGPQASDDACRAFAGWLGRYYTRIALPNELVIRLKGAVFDPLLKFLRQSPQGDGPKNHEGVHSIYVRWEPMTELPTGDPYDVDFLILCDDPLVAEALETKLGGIGLSPGERVDKNDLRVNCSVQARGETVLTDLDGSTRLTEWDYLTGLGETSTMPASP